MSVVTVTLNVETGGSRVGDQLRQSWYNILSKIKYKTKEMRAWFQW
jgi:hypothetical protein